MKKLLLFFSCFPGLISAQYSFNFEDSTLNLWKQVPSERWIISETEALSGFFSLHHGFDNPESGCDIIAFYYDSPELSDTLSISFRIKHSYNPSSNNNWQVSILNALEPTALSNDQLTDGIYFGVNLKGSDDMVKLWQVTDREVIEILNSGINYQEEIGTGNSPLFRVSRYPDGRWEAFCQPSGNEEDLLSLGISGRTDPTYGRSFLLRYSYSSAQDRKLWFDDLQIDGTFFIDRVPPCVVNVILKGLDEVLIEFDEPVDTELLTTFLLNDEFYPDSVEVSDMMITLSFTEIFENRIVQMLRINGVGDIDGNILKDTVVYFTPNNAEWGDIVINEVMSDPVPPVYLPECEYIELYNLSEWDMTLDDWSLEINGRSYSIPGYLLSSKAYVVLTDSECIPHFILENQVSCFTSGSALSNTGGQIALYDQYGKLVHVMVYTSLSDELSWKNEGGWSIECLDPSYLCGNKDNWNVSTDPAGGTPGRLNSLNQIVIDETPPFILYSGMNDNGSIRLHFSELINTGSTGTHSFLIKPGDTHPDSIKIDYPWFSNLDAYFPEGVVGKVKSELQLQNISDCAGNRMDDQIVRIGLPQIPEFQSLLINEVMFDPEDGAPEFVEIYNHAEYFIDLIDFMIGVSGPDYLPEDHYPLCHDSHIVAPGEFLVLTSDEEALMKYYRLEQSGRWIAPGHLPTLVNSGGVIYLYDRSGNLIDYMNYDETMHVEIIDGTKGISLERISYANPGYERSNWHSAASIEFYATPGRSNSQSSLHHTGGEILTINPTVFSPDNDGFEDVLEILLKMDRAGFVLQMHVTDIAGNLVISLANNDILGIENRYFWDGRNHIESMVIQGLYLLHINIFHPANYEKRNMKKAFAVIYR